MVIIPVVVKFGFQLGRGEWRNSSGYNVPARIKMLFPGFPYCLCEAEWYSPRTNDAKAGSSALVSPVHVQPLLSDLLPKRRSSKKSALNVCVCFNSGNFAPSVDSRVREKGTVSFHLCHRSFEEAFPDNPPVPGEKEQRHSGIQYNLHVHNYSQ